MKQNYRIAFIMLLTSFFIFWQELKAQDNKIRKLGKASDFIKDIKRSDSLNARARSGGKNKFKLDPEGKLESELKQFSKVGKEEIYTGYVGKDKSSNVALYINDGQVTGTIIAQNHAYTYKTKNGEVYLEETAIDSLICVKTPVSAPSRSSARTSAVTPPLLESRPGAPVVIYLDFDGEVVKSPSWNGGNTINAAPSALTYEEMVLTYEIMSEDFAPFNINITTIRSVYDTAPVGSKNMCIFTTTTYFRPGVGGVAMVGSLSNTSFTPCWAFNYGGKMAGETGSHEIGHVLGLRHDGHSPSSGSGEYYSGHTNNVWGPIMGDAFNPAVVQWSKGEYQAANNQQDDLYHISRLANKAGYVTDEAGSTLGSARYLNYTSSGSLYSNMGMISKTSDVDVYRFKTNGGNINITLATAPTVTSGGIAYPITNLDAKMELLNSSGGLIVSSDPAGTANPNISRSLSAGVYYLRIDGVGSGNPLSDGYTEYASLGRYTLTGTIQGAASDDLFLSISEPEDNIILTNPSTVTIKPNYKSATGITKVEFFEGSVKLGESTVSPFYFSKSNFTDGSHTIHIKATNAANQTVTSSAITFNLYRQIPAEAAGDIHLNGIYEFYEGSFTQLPNFNTITPAYRGTIDGIRLDNTIFGVPRNRTDNFAIRYKGLFYVMEDGVYRFSLTSDDGSKLFIGNKLVIDNNGLHAEETKTTTLMLSRGFIPLELQYFEATGGETLSLTMHDVLANKESIVGLWTRDADPISSISLLNRNLLSGVRYEYNEGTYNQLPVNFNTLPLQKIGALTNFSLAVPNRRADNFAVHYKGYIDVPYDGEWVFYLTSDEGSKLYVADNLIINHDGLHTATERSSSIWLKRGRHKIKVEYFEKTGTETLSLQYSGPATPRQNIPNNSLSREGVLGEEISYQYFTPSLFLTLEAEHYDQGGEGYSYHDLTRGNSFGYFREDDVDLKPAPSGIGYVVTGVQPGEWLKYSVTSSKENHDVRIRVGSGATGSTITLYSFITGKAFSVAVPPITNGELMQDVYLRNVNLGKGAGQILVILNGTYDFDNMRFGSPGTLRGDSDVETITENTYHNKIVVYPNPFDTKINLDLTGFENVESVRILDLRGATIWQSSGSDLNRDLLTIEENLTSGMYLVEVNADGNISRTQIIKSY
jgi:hypothetical protein